MNISKIVLHLYPRPWRARYEDELLELFEQRPLSVTDTVDMVIGAINAHLHPQLGTTGMPVQERMLLLQHHLRGSLVTIFCAYISFVVAGLGFMKLCEGNDMMAAANTYHLVGDAYALVQLGALLSLFAVLAGGIPIAIEMLKDAYLRRKGEIVLLLSIPVCAFGALLAFIAIGNHMAPLLRRSELSAIAFFGFFLFLAIISTAAVSVATMRSNVSVRCSRFALWPSIVVIVTMVVVLLSIVLWGAGLLHAAPAVLFGQEGIMRSSTVESWLRIIIMMVLANCIGILSLIRAMNTGSVLRTTTSS